MLSEQRIYPNGLKLIINQTDSPMACVLFRVETGVAYELKKYEGITSVLEKMLLCGTTNYPSKNSLRSAIGAFGGEISVVGEYDCVRIYVKCLAKYLDKAAEIVSQVAFNSTFDSVELNDIKKTINSYRKAQKDSPFLLAYDNLREVVFAGTGFEKNFFGRKNSLNFVDTESLKNYWHRSLCPKNVIVSVSGGVEAETVYDAVLNNIYGKFVEFNGKKSKDIPHFENNGETRFVLDTKKINQARIVVGYSTNGASSKDYFSLLLLKHILHSELNDMFAKKGDVFLPGCYINSYKNNGIFYFRFACDMDTASENVKKVSELFLKIYSNGISNSEFVSFKESFKTQYAKQFETQDTLCKVSSNHMEYFGFAFDLDYELEQIDKLTQGDCLKAFGKILKKQPFMSVVGSSRLNETLYYDFCEKIRSSL